LHNEGQSVISDSAGTLLFYTNGEVVWNKNHQIMPNGSGLLGNISSTQSSIIVPMPKSERYYYIFTTDAWACGGTLNGLRYSVVDICADALRGDVISNEKNILLLDWTCEKVAVTRHANGNDYWILTHKFNSNEFYAFLLTSNGITDTVISAIGSVHSGSIVHSMGQLKFSPNGQRIAIGLASGAIGPADSLRTLDVFDFNKSTGVISNFLKL
jgi:hypothetical protein